MPRAWLDLASLESDSRGSLLRPLASEDDLPFALTIFWHHFLTAAMLLMRQLLSYTPIFVTQRFPDPSYKKDLQAEYYIGLGSIRVDNNSIPLNTSLLSIDRKGFGGTIFSTVCPYTELETSIYNSLTTAFIAEAAAMNIARVASVAPFSACFSSNSIQSTRDGGSSVTIY